MSKFNHYLGIDVSKAWLDACLTDQQEQIVLRMRVANTATGLSKLFKAVCKEGVQKELLLVCAEHTGIYTLPLVRFASQKNLFLWLEQALQLQRSSGLLRGKTDEQDAFRIARYACRFASQAVAYEQPSAEIQQLRHLQQARRTLLQQRAQLKVQLKETEQFSPDQAKLLSGLWAKTLKALEQDIRAVDQQIIKWIAKHPQLQRLIRQSMTVPGVGLQTALELVWVTRGFTILTDAKKLACYAGIAPFPKQSGSSLNARHRVSPLANKVFKKTIHMAALAAIRAKGEMQDYFIRKVAEGKSKMAVVNAIRYKVMSRTLSVIKRNEDYTESYFPKNCQQLLTTT